MDDKNTLDRLKASYITLAEDYRMVQKKLPKAISVNNSTAQDADTAQWFDALWETLKKQLSQIN